MTTPRKLIRHLKNGDWIVSAAFDGEEWTPVEGEQEAMAIVNAVDWSNLEFQYRGPGPEAVIGRRHRVAIITSNGDEWLSDWTLPAAGKSDDFDKLMDTFLEAMA